MYIITQEEKKYKKKLFALFDSSPFCRVGYELDLCPSCAFYNPIVDYCDKGLFEADEKEGGRLSIEDCLEYIILECI
ncbi:MAG: hypothetical protein WCL18_01320 [bacterium]